MKRREFRYIVFDYDGEREIGAFSSFTLDTCAKMRNYLVKHGDIPNDALVRTEYEIKVLGA